MSISGGTTNGHSFARESPHFFATGTMQRRQIAKKSDITIDLNIGAHGSRAIASTVIESLRSAAASSHAYAPREPPRWRASTTRITSGSTTSVIASSQSTATMITNRPASYKL
jgi:hypothetical protein